MRKQSITISLTPATLEQIETMAERDKRSVSSMVHVLVDEAIRHREFLVKTFETGECGDE